MSEWAWIDKRDRRPNKGQHVCHTDGEGGYWTMPDIGHDEWTHWMPIPPPPTRMVTIEISEKTARWYVEQDYGGGHSAVVVAACRKALEASK